MGHFQPTSASAGCSGFWLFSAWPSFPWASLKLKQRQLPIQRLIPILSMEATTVLDIITTATLTTATMARDLLRLSLLLMLKPRLKLTPWYGYYGHGYGLGYYRGYYGGHYGYPYYGYYGKRSADA